jgi:asparagine synthetase B (glutamine-hydrolysing)
MPSIVETGAKTALTVLDWTAAFGKHASIGPDSLVRFGSETSGSALQITGPVAEHVRAASAVGPAGGAFFDGVLYNRSEVEKNCGPDAWMLTDAALLLRLYELWGGIDSLRRIKGIFALLIWDRLTDSLVAARDPLGSYPLFYARTATGLVLSTSTSALLRHDGVPRELNRAALADHLSHRWPDPQETFLAGVKRVPPGHRLEATRSGLTLTRYWDPTPPGEPIQWVREDELGRFDALLDEAVARCYRQGRTGIFLSGGFDSISIAAVATDGARRDRQPRPIALSLGFPIPECNEEEVQRSVARSLGLNQELLAFEQAVAPDGLLANVLEMARTWPAPILNTWMPAYVRLAERGRRHGVSVILTGSGGDEWLSVSPYFSADLLRNLDFSGWWHFLHAWKRSYRVSWPQVLRGGISTYGLRPLMSSALDTAFHRPWTYCRVERVMRKTPDWVAPDADLRDELRSRVESSLMPLSPEGGYYLQEIRSGMDHSLMSLELEETYELGSRLGARILHPYWDADLVDMLYRTPPHLLNRGGRSKGLVRESVAKRFPTLGFKRHKKVVATSFFRTTLVKEAGAAWKRLGGVRALGDLGVVDPAATARTFADIMSQPISSSAYQLWDILSCETWARERA